MAEGKLRASASRGAARLVSKKTDDDDEGIDEYAFSASSKKRNLRVEDRLAKKAEEYAQRRKHRVEMIERKTNEMSRKVATNRRSDFLAGDRENKSTLHRPIGNVRPSTISEMSKECTFSPVLNKPPKNKKSQFAQKHQNVQRQRKVTKVADPVFERNQKWLEKRQLKQQQKRSEKLKSSAEKYTVRCQPTLFRINITYLFTKQFRPRINHNSKPREKIGLSIAERSREWLQAKQIKQQQKRSEKENEALRECTFRPNRIVGGLATTVVKSRNTRTKQDHDDDNDGEEEVWNYYETDDGYVYSHNPKTGETRWAEEHEVKIHTNTPSGCNDTSSSSPMEPESLDQAFRRVLNPS